MDATQEQIKELEKRIEAVEKGKADKTHFHHFHREKPISVVGKPIKEPWIPEVIV